jgi:hypothetical protein
MLPVNLFALMGSNRQPYTRVLSESHPVGHGDLS